MINYNDNILNKTKKYEDKMIFHKNAHNNSKLKKYKKKYSKIFVGGNVDDDLKKLKEIELQLTNQFISQESGLLDYQKPHADKLIKILEKNNSALDASEPGIGKTYIASFICKEMGLKPIVICPKNVINSWIKVLKLFNVEYITVTNYELMTRGKYLINNAKIMSPYIKIKKEKKLSYEWNVDPNIIFIFDEVHKCKFINTKNAKLLLAAKETGNKILMLSATIVEKPSEFAIFAYMLGFSNSLKVLTEWIKKLTSPSKTLHTLLYDSENSKASRLTISELGDKFPNTQITADTYTMKQSNEISKEYEKIFEKIKAFKTEGENSKFIITKLQTEFRNIELLKIPTFVELANDYIENNYSVVIFVNYTETLKLLGEKLNTKTLIYGGQTLTERDKCINDFQSDKSRIIICNIKAGGVGISLHDINGKHPRVSLISPTQSATNLIQALGRIYRSGGKSKSLQRIIFSANTPEDDISKMLFRKLSNLSLLNDGDLESYYIDGLIKDEDYLKHQKTSSTVDIGIAIDEQLEKIKHKKFIKTDKMSNLFPNLINIISGVQNIFLLKSKKLFNNKEILLLGEDHEFYKPCKTCGNNCLEVSDLITYVSNSIYPKIINFYVEHPYNPNDTTKKFYIGKSNDASRLSNFFDYYKHLLNNKHSTTENIHLHAVDIRPRGYNDYDIEYVFYILTYISYELLGYLSDRLFSNLIKPNNETELIYEKNINEFKTIKDGIKTTNKFLKDIIENPELNDILKKILKGDSLIFDKFKLTKQKNKFIETYGDKSEEFVNLVEIGIFKIFQYDSECYDFLKFLYETLNKIDHITDTKEYMTKVINKLVKKKHSYELIKFDINLKLMNMLSTYMDYYTIFRMLRKFDDVEQDNVIFYGGSAHSNNIFDILKSTKYFEVLISKNENTYLTKNDCQHF
jgi:superfamily II DNA or RNA helicase